jgi:hypothetical protein
MKTVRSSACFALLLCLLAPAAFAQTSGTNPPSQLVISRAIAEGLDDPLATVTIDGANFGNNPKVYLGIAGGLSQQLAVLSNTPTKCRTVAATTTCAIP